jgi:hypothetical protein
MSSARARRRVGRPGCSTNIGLSSISGSKRNGRSEITFICRSTGAAGIGPIMPGRFLKPANGQAILY